VSARSLLGAVLVTVRLDLQVGATLIEDAPQRTALPGGAPPGLVHVQRRGLAQAIEELVAGLGEGLGGAAQDRLDGAG
jgi:hypothetical protein